MIKTFRDLHIWRHSMNLTEEVYSISCLLPEDERFGLKSQMRRAAVSIPSNIAEGFGRKSNKDFKRFLRIAIGSLFELQTQIELSSRLFGIQTERFDKLYDQSRELERVLVGFIRSI